MRIARTSSRSARTVLRFVPHLGLLLAVIAVVLMALVPIGWRGGWWPYRFSLLSLMAYSAYFGIAAVIVSVLALSLQGDATTPRVKQYLDKMIAHCEGLAGRVEPGKSSAADRRYAGRSRMSRNHHRLQPGFGNTSREGAALFRGWITTGTGLDLTGRTY